MKLLMTCARKSATKILFFSALCMSTIGAVSAQGFCGSVKANVEATLIHFDQAADCESEVHWYFSGSRFA
jgi:hypothetical protein